MCVSVSLACLCSFLLFFFKPSRSFTVSSPQVPYSSHLYIGVCVCIVCSWTIGHEATVSRYYIRRYYTVMALRTSRTLGVLFLQRWGIQSIGAYTLFSGCSLVRERLHVPTYLCIVFGRELYLLVVFSNGIDLFVVGECTYLIFAKLMDWGRKAEHGTFRRYMYTWQFIASVRIVRIS